MSGQGPDLAAGAGAELVDQRGGLRGRVPGGAHGADELDDVSSGQRVERGGQVHEGARPGHAEPPALAQVTEQQARDLAGDRGAGRLARTSDRDGDGGDAQALGERGEVAAGGGRVDDLDADDTLGARLVEQARDLEAGESVAPGELDLRHALEVVLAREGDLERDRLGRTAAGSLIRRPGWRIRLPGADVRSPGTRVRLPDSDLLARLPGRGLLVHSRLLPPPTAQIPSGEGRWLLG